MNTADEILHSLSRTEGIIFDLDGTLWNALPATVEAWNEVVAANYPDRAPLTEADIGSVTGKPFEECVEILFPAVTGAERKELFKKLDEAEKAVLQKKGGQLYPGVGETLSRLALSYDLFIVSNCQKWYLQNFFKHHPLAGFFKGWDCHGMSESSKASMLKDVRSSYVMEHLVYVGDTRLDCSSAEEASIPFIYASYGFDSEVQSELSIHEISDILRLFY